MKARAFLLGGIVGFTGGDCVPEETPQTESLKSLPRLSAFIPVMADSP